MRNHVIFGIALSLVAVLPRYSLGNTATYVSCNKDQAKQEARSMELQEIYAADQADRKTIPLLPGVQERDRARRERVGQIFGEGCINSPADYAASAMVYQHGDMPDHFFQTFMWSKRGVEQGNLSQKRLMALGLDRYLVNIGHKELFASQFNKLFPDGCWCLEPVEKSFPESMRTTYMGETLADQYARVDTLNKGATCPTDKECKHEFLPSPQGTVPGFW